jgi:16S rRNA (guanine527-N7)-methyltransferase
VTDAEAKRRIAESVSRETLIRLEIYEQVLRKWQPKLNLISNGTLSELWTRHFLDSFQVFELAPKSGDLWLDLGSGGGFPGMVCAICAEEGESSPRFELVESDTRKCAFLREVARQTGVSVSVRNARIEALPPAGADIVSARALALCPGSSSGRTGTCDRTVSVCFKRAPIMAWSLKPRAPTGRWRSTSSRR